MKELTIICLIIIGMILLSGYLINENKKIDNEFQIKCIQEGGSISQLPGKNTYFVCVK